MNELRNRGVEDEDILLAVVDGLKGFSDAIRAVFPKAMVQTCVVHLLCHSLEFVTYEDRKLGAFEEGHWGRRYPAIAQSWRRAWSEVVPFYAFPADVRRILYTTNDECH
jgi:putative transposase